MSERRYALQPLCDALACSPDGLKARLGLDNRQVAAYVSRGLTEARADQLAAAAGLPALLVWPEMVEHAIEDADREREERLARNRAQDAARKRERWANDPEYRARKAQYQRRYREEARAALVAYKRRWRLENPDRVREANRRSTRAWKARNPEKVAEQRRRQYLRQRERQREAA